MLVYTYARVLIHLWLFINDGRHFMKHTDYISEAHTSIVLELTCKKVICMTLRNVYIFGNATHKYIVSIYTRPLCICFVVGPLINSDMKIILGKSTQLKYDIRITGQKSNFYKNNFLHTLIGTNLFVSVILACVRFNCKRCTLAALQSCFVMLIYRSRRTLTN